MPRSVTYPEFQAGVESCGVAVAHRLESQIAQHTIDSIVADVLAELRKYGLAGIQALGDASSIAAKRLGVTILLTEVNSIWTRLPQDVLKAIENEKVHIISDMQQETPSPCVPRPSPVTQLPVLHRTVSKKKKAGKKSKPKEPEPEAQKDVPFIPTMEKPGSLDKIKVMIERAAQGLPLHHDNDCRDHSKEDDSVEPDDDELRKLEEDEDDES